jgi:hypothetical protein
MTSKGQERLHTTIRSQIRPYQHFLLFKSKIRIGLISGNESHNFEDPPEKVWAGMMAFSAFPTRPLADLETADGQKMQDK